MNRIVHIQRARSVPIDTKFLQRIVRALLEDLLELNSFELGIQLVRAKAMAHVNETFLNHAGPTDVITFDHSELKTSLHGELFVCYDVAQTQAKEFRTTWPSEIVRYAVHGVLHLQGFDDHRAADRRRMKREEDRLVKALAQSFAFSKLTKGQA